MKKALTLTVALLAITASMATAGGVNLYWNNCGPLGTGTPPPTTSVAFACNSNAGALTAIGSVIRPILEYVDDVKQVILRQRRMEIMLNEETLNTAVLSKVFAVLNENKVALVSVRSVGQQTEQAYLDLVEKEESRGFTRLYSPAEAA